MKGRIKENTEDYIEFSINFLNIGLGACVGLEIDFSVKDKNDKIKNRLNILPSERETVRFVVDKKIKGFVNIVVTMKYKDIYNNKYKQIINVGKSPFQQLKIHVIKEHTLITNT